MNKREFTPEEIAKSLRVCFGTCCGCGGCIYEVEPDLSSPEVDCRTDLVNIAAGTIKAQAKRIGELEAELAKLREENRWISVEERMPTANDGNDDGEVLAVWIGGKVMNPTPAICGGTCAQNWKYVAQHPEFFSHWKPMPKGPEVGHD